MEPALSERLRATEQFEFLKIMGYYICKRLEIITVASCDH